MEYARFFLEYLKCPRAIGAIAPTSGFLIETIIKEIDVQHAHYVIELGAGTGKITKAILKRLKKNQRLIACESNPRFLPYLKRIHDKRLTVLALPAEELSNYLNAHNILHVNYIISSLPITSLPKATVHRILHTIAHTLTPHGRYIQYGLYPKHYKVVNGKLLMVKVKFTLLNFPPSFVFVFEKQ